MELYLASFDSCDFVTFGSLSSGVAIKTFSDMVVSDMCGLVIQARPGFVGLILNPRSRIHSCGPLACRHVFELKICKGNCACIRARGSF